MASHADTATDEGGLQARHERLRARNDELTSDNVALRAQLQKVVLGRTGFRDLLDAMEVATVFLDAGLRLTHYTPSAAAILQLSSGDLGLPFGELAADLPYPEFASDAAAVLARNTPSDRDLGHRDGNWYLARLLPHRTAHEGVIGVVLHFVEIGTRREAERSHRWLSTVVGASQDAIVSFDLDLRVLSWNGGAQQTFGASAEEMIGRPLELAADREDGHLPDLRRVCQGESFQAGSVCLRRDGQELRVSLRAAPIHDSAGRVIGGVVIARDLTEPQRARDALERSSAELRAALQELEAADEAKDRFLAVLSHELRNPLASVSSAIEVLASGRTAQHDHALAVARRQLGATRRLLDDLLDVSRLRLGRLALRMSRFPLRQVIGTAVEMATPAIAEHGHELVVGQPEHDVVLEGDAVRLAQLLANLLVNSARYTPDGGLIRVTARAAGARLSVDVEDNGMGMDEDELQQMFGLFVQAAGGRSQGSGLGIGLALAQSIAELHGGSLTAASSGKGQGSRVSLSLPLPAAEPVSAPPPPAPAEQGGEGTALPVSAQLLIVDDNADAVWGLRTMLELAGHRVLSAATGAEGFDMAKEHRPAVLLLDIGLPDMSGLELARRIRSTEWGPSLSLVALTGLGRDSDVRESREAGFDAHLTKPAEMQQLRALLTQLLAGQAAASLSPAGPEAPRLPR